MLELGPVGLGGRTGPRGGKLERVLGASGSYPHPRASSPVVMGGKLVPGQLLPGEAVRVHGMMDSVVGCVLQPSSSLRLYLKTGTLRK